MAKKSRRTRQRPAETIQPVHVTRTPRSPLATPAPREVDFRREYAYVIDDLKRIGLIAAALLILLIVLALLLA